MRVEGQATAASLAPAVELRAVASRAVGARERAREREREREIQRETRERDEREREREKRPWRPWRRR